VAAPYWACAQLQASREAFALHCLAKVAGYQIYSPRIRAPKRARPSTLRTRPLFPGYCFVLVVAGWWSARWSPGVVRIVLDGSVPAKVPDSVIDELRRRERSGVVELPGPPGLRQGAPVRVTRGPFQSLVGLYAGQAPHERVAILLSVLGSQQRVTLPKDAIAAVLSRW
jgi:transcriptional antiterminator RfaH